MKARELRNLGFPRGEVTKLALKTAGVARRSGLYASQIREEYVKLIEYPIAYECHEIFGDLAKAFKANTTRPFIEREEPAPWSIYASDIDPGAIKQMENACRLPIAVAGALMPDAHRGYGLPIGGVLATENAIIPYAVGVDIACRMKLSVFDLPVSALKGEKQRLINAIKHETRFGIGAGFQKKYRREHAVLDEDWDATEITKSVKDKAWKQLGSSGSGNHFVEFGTLTLSEDELGLKAGQYLAFLSHSGSRGPGAMTAGYYSKLARSLHPELPKELAHLSWLDMDSEAGQEYWYAMNLMGQFAAANHECIHDTMRRRLGVKILAGVENHHNFAWKEHHNGKDVYVHRKGATPAGKGVLGIIPGSMADPGFVVRGKGNALSLESAAHGAGRVMSRTAAKKSITWSSVKKTLNDRGVTLISAGIDEAPDVYKDIEKVMAQQSDLVETIARFDPKIVKMAQAGEPPED